VPPYLLIRGPATRIAQHWYRGTHDAQRAGPTVSTTIRDPEKGRRLVQDHAEKSARKPDVSTDLAIDRTRLAYERTLLAWVRTATSLITFGFAIQQFFRIARAGAPESKGIIEPHGFGLTMITVGLLALLLAKLEHRSNILALQQQYPAMEPHGSRARLLAGLIAVLGLLGLVSMLFHE
jgi:putative membrane protein